MFFNIKVNIYICLLNVSQCSVASVSFTKKVGIFHSFVLGQFQRALVNKAKQNFTFIICRKDISLLQDDICETMGETSVNNLKMLFLLLIFVLIWSEQDNAFAFQGKNNCFLIFYQCSCYFSTVALNNLENGYIQMHNASIQQFLAPKSGVKLIFMCRTKQFAVKQKAFLIHVQRTFRLNFTNWEDA